MSDGEEWETITNPLAREDQRRYNGETTVNPNAFPTVKLPDVTDAERIPLANVHAIDEAQRTIKFHALMSLLWKARTGPQYNGTVPAATRRARRKTGKAQRTARKVHR